LCFVTDTVYLLACRLHIAPLTLFHSYYKPTLGYSVPFLTFVQQGYCFDKVREIVIP